MHHLKDDLTHSNVTKNKALGFQFGIFKILSEFLHDYKLSIRQHFEYVLFSFFFCRTIKIENAIVDNIYSLHI